MGFADYLRDKAKAEKKVDTSAYQQAAQTMKQAGISGVGDPGLKERRKRSKDAGWTPPTGGGRITETTPGGVIRVDQLPDETDVDGGVTTITPDIDTSKYSTAIINKIFSQLTPEQAALVKKLRGQGKPDNVILMQLQQSKWADDNLIDLLSGEGIKKLIAGKASLFKKPEYEQDFLGSAGAANVLRKLEGMTDKERQEFINATIAKNPEGAREMFGPNIGKGKDIDYTTFRNTLVDKNIGNKNFDKAYDPESYYSIHQPQTGRGIEQLSKLDASLYPDIANQIFAAREQVGRDRTQDRMNMPGQYPGSGGSGGGATPTDPTQPTTLPEDLLAQQYIPGLTPSYTGGPEQTQGAGGYFDPRTGKWIGSPWGTQQSYQGALPGTNPILFANQGGMVNDKGIMGFKKYGY